MKKLLKITTYVTLLFLFPKNNIFAQQWTGSSTNTGTITHNGPVIMGNESKVGTGTGALTFGDGYNNTMFGLGYIGFNLEKSGSNWNYLSNGFDNGCGLFYMNLGGDYNFSSRQSNSTTGAVGGSLTPTDIDNNIKMRLSSTGKLSIGSPFSPYHKLFVQTSTTNDGIMVTQTGTTAATLELNNTSASGKRWAFQSTGSGNSQGAGHFIIYDNSGGGNRFFIQGSTGNIGIGTITPTQKVDVAGTIKATGFILPTGAGVNKVLTSDATGNASWQTGTGNYWQAATVGTNNVINSNTGGIIIGTGVTSVPSGYKLYVSNGILTEKIKVAVKTTSDWSDYVFSPQYKLKPLLEVEAFIEKNKHLPNVPSAEDVVSNGIDLAKMDATLLQKIEELTLYMIELKKENEELKKMIVQKIK